MKNIPPYIIITVITALICYVLFRPDYSPYDREKEQLKKEIDSLMGVEVKIKDSLSLLKDLTIKQQIEIDSITLVKLKYKIIRDEIPNNVAGYSTSKLDSALADYVHPRGN